MCAAAEGGLASGLPSDMVGLLLLPLPAGAAVRSMLGARWGVAEAAAALPPAAAAAGGGCRRVGGAAAAGELSIEAVVACSCSDLK